MDDGDDDEEEEEEEEVEEVEEGEGGGVLTQNNSYRQSKQWHDAPGFDLQKRNLLYFPLF